MSLFHRELLKFLQQQAGDQLGEGEALRAVQGRLQTSVLTNLEETIRSYRDALHRAGPAVEQQWLRALRDEEATARALQLPWPKVYRGLPREYRRASPSESRIKAPFCDLRTLLRCSVEPAVWELYRYLPVAEGARVIVLVWVMPDGLGDWSAAVATAEILSSASFDVSLIALSARPLPPCRFPTQQFALESRIEPLCLPPEVLELMRNADLVLQIPTLIPQTPQLYEQILNRASSRPSPLLREIGEYGFIESSWYHPRTGRPCMGLHALEQGILIRPSPPAKNENHQLREWGAPGANLFYFAYLATPQGGAIYLNSLLWSLAEDPRDIDLCCPDANWWIRWLVEQGEAGQPALLPHLNVRRIEWLSPDGRRELSVAQTGKTLRLLVPGPLTSEECRSLIEQSGDWVGVRGNQSFSEAVSAGKPFFYDGRSHNAPFLKDLCAVAQNRLSLRVPLYFLEPTPQEGEWVDQSFFQQPLSWQEHALALGAALRNDRLNNRLKKLTHILREEHRCNESILAWAIRLLAHRRFPRLAQQDETLVQRYLDRKTSLSALVKNLGDGIMQAEASL